MTQEERTVILGALLHDIWKFKQRAYRNELRGQTHQQIGHDWLQQMGYSDEVSSAALNHHLGDTLHSECWMDLLICAADHLFRGTAYSPERVEKKGKKVTFYCTK